MFNVFKAAKAGAGAVTHAAEGAAKAGGGFFKTVAHAGVAINQKIEDGKAFLTKAGQVKEFVLTYNSQADIERGELPPLEAPDYQQILAYYHRGWLLMLELVKATFVRIAEMEDVQIVKAEVVEK